MFSHDRFGGGHLEAEEGGGEYKRPDRPHRPPDPPTTNPSTKLPPPPDKETRVEVNELRPDFPAAYTITGETGFLLTEEEARTPAVEETPVHDASASMTGGEADGGALA